MNRGHCRSLYAGWGLHTSPQSTQVNRLFSFLEILGIQWWVTTTNGNQRLSLIHIDTLETKDIFQYVVKIFYRYTAVHNTFFIPKYLKNELLLKLQMIRQNEESKVCVLFKTIFVEAAFLFLKWNTSSDPLFLVPSGESCDCWGLGWPGPGFLRNGGWVWGSGGWLGESRPPRLTRVVLNLSTRRKYWYENKLTNSEFSTRVKFDFNLQKANLWLPVLSINSLCFLSFQKYCNKTYCLNWINIEIFHSTKISRWILNCWKYCLPKCKYHSLRIKCKICFLLK